MYQSKKEKRTSYGRLPHWLLGGALCLVGHTAYADSSYNMESLSDTRSLMVSKHNTRTISGTVTDKSGEPIIGANVLVKGTSQGIITDLDGNFTLNNVPANAELVISYIGYKEQTIKIGSQTSFSVKLVEDTELIDEVVVVGYASQKKIHLTGSVASVDMGEIAEKRPITNLSSGLAGMAAGVSVTSSSNVPGNDNASILVRGQGSLNNSAPLVIIDGVESNINTVAPQDVETMTVLKDAASAAIYGVQAANGVILITTKQGKKGDKTRINYSGTFSWASPVAKREYVNAYEFATLYNEATYNENPNAPLPFTEEQIEQYRTGALPSTDWYDAAFKKNAFEQMHNVSISGGSEKTTYNGSLGYTKQNGLTDEIDYSRFNARMNLTSDINKYLTVGMNASGYRGVSQDAWNGFINVFQGVSRQYPTDPIYNEDGTFYYSGKDNPVAVQGGKSGFTRNTQQELNLTTFATIHILPELSVKGVYSVRNYTSNQDGFKRHFSYGNEASSFDSGLREGYDKYYTNNYYTGQVLINYNKTFGKHTIGALAGFESYEHIYKYTEATRKGGGNDELGESLNTLDESSQKNSDGGYEMARLSYFGRIQYDYLGKYLFEANLRSDASSRFPKDNRWGVFPAFSAGWRISEESFVKDNIDWLSNLKLRLGWGKTGNEELSSSDIYPAVPTYA